MDEWVIILGQPNPGRVPTFTFSRVHSKQLVKDYSGEQGLLGVTPYHLIGWAFQKLFPDSRIAISPAAASRINAQNRAITKLKGPAGALDLIKAGFGDLDQKAGASSLTLKALAPSNDPSSDGAFLKTNLLFVDVIKGGRAAEMLRVSEWLARRDVNGTVSKLTRSKSHSSDDEWIKWIWENRILPNCQTKAASVEVDTQHGVLAIRLHRRDARRLEEMLRFFSRRVM